MDCTTDLETDFAWERFKPHPMCIPHIVDGILAFLNVFELKACRLVSSQYNEIACKALQHKESIVFKTLAQLERYLSTVQPISLPPSLLSSGELSFVSSLSKSSLGFYYKFESDDDTEREQEYGKTDEKIRRIRNSHDMGNDSNENCLRSQYRYSHRSFHFHYCDPKSDIKPMDEFFSKFGPQIQSLKYTTDLLPSNVPKPLGHMGDIWQNRLANLEELILEMKWGIPLCLFADGNDDHGQVSLPSLRQLHVDVLLSDRDADRAQLFLQQLLSVTPNLEEISIPVSKRFFDDYINVVLTRAIIASHLPRLSTLNFCMAMSDAQMRLFARKGLPLSTLILDLEDLQFDPDVEDAENGNENEPQVDFNMEQDNMEPPHHVEFPDNNNDEDNEIRNDFLNQNQNRRPSFTPVVKASLQMFLNSVATTLQSLHICFPQSPRHSLHSFTFHKEMTNLKFLAMGHFAGTSQILDRLPALKKLELLNVKFSDCHGHGKVVPDRYQNITSVIS